MNLHMVNKRNRKIEYPNVLTGRVADRHVAVVNAYMSRFKVSKAEAIRMALDASARYLLEEDDNAT